MIVRVVLLLKTTKTCAYLKYWQVVSILERMAAMMMMRKMMMIIWTLRTKMMASKLTIRWATEPREKTELDNHSIQPGETYEFYLG